MRYFLLEQDKGYTDIPVPLGWYEILAPGKAMESLKKLPRRTIFKIKTGENTVFLDFMTDPVVMVSEKVKECLELYEPNIPFKEISSISISLPSSALYDLIPRLPRSSLLLSR